jgi:hypothetical protein
MFGCYRKDEVADPDFYLTAAVGILTRYQRETIMRVTDPRTGLPSTSKFLPSIAELKEVCEKEQAWFDERSARELQRANQFKYREEYEKEQAHRHNRPTYDELKKAAGPNWGLSAAADSEEEIRRKEAMRASVERANNIAFERECAAAGVDPARGTSPALLKMLGRNIRPPKGEF